MINPAAIVGPDATNLLRTLQRFTKIFDPLYLATVMAAGIHSVCVSDRPWMQAFLFCGGAILMSKAMERIHGTTPFGFSAFLFASHFAQQWEAESNADCISVDETGLVRVVPRKRPSVSAGVAAAVIPSPSPTTPGASKKAKQMKNPAAEAVPTHKIVALVVTFIVTQFARVWCTPHSYLFLVSFVVAVLFPLMCPLTRPLPVIIGSLCLAISAAVQTLWFWNHRFGNSGSATTLVFVLCVVVVVSVVAINSFILLIYQTNFEMHQLSEAKNKFISRCSHELRSPLQSCLATLDSLIEYEDQKGTYGSALADCRAACWTAISFTNDFLDIMKSGSAGLTLRLSDFDLASVIDEAWNVAKPMARSKNIKFTRRVPEVGAITMRGDRSKLVQIAINALCNALKHTASEGSVRLSIAHLDDWLVFNIRDTGCGIPSHLLTKVFDPFFQVRPEDIGSGLGLSLVKEYVEAMQGRIELQSSTDKDSHGTVVRIFLPFPEQCDGAPAAPSLNMSPTAARRRPPQLLHPSALMTSPSSTASPPGQQGQQQQQPSSSSSSSSSSNRFAEDVSSVPGTPPTIYLETRSFDARAIVSERAPSGPPTAEALQRHNHSAFDSSNHFVPLATCSFQDRLSIDQSSSGTGSRRTSTCSALVVEESAPVESNDINQILSCSLDSNVTTLASASAASTPVKIKLELKALPRDVSSVPLTSTPSTAAAAAAAATSASSSASAAAVALPTAPVPCAGKTNIFLCEDDLMLQKVLLRLLLRICDRVRTHLAETCPPAAKDIEVRTFSNGKEMVDFYLREVIETQRTEPPILIISDLQMPIMNGTTAFRSLRDACAVTGQEQPPYLSCLLSGDILEMETELESCKCPIDEKLFKPVRHAVLHQIVLKAVAGAYGIDMSAVPNFTSSIDAGGPGM